MTPKQWNRRYARCDLAYGSEPNAFFESVAKLIKDGDTVLFVGDGEGRNSVWLAERCRCVAVDWAEAGLRKCRALAKSKGRKVETIQADVSTDLADYRVDAVVNVFCAVADRRGMHRRCLDMLKPGGLFIAELFGPGSTVGPRDDRVATSADLVRDVRGSADVLLAEDLDRVVSEGHYHASPHLQRVARLVARKRTFKSYVDRLFFEPCCEPSDDDDESDKSEETDAMLRHASTLVNLAIKEATRAGRCRYCWQQTCACALFSSLLPEKGDHRDDEDTFFFGDFVVLCHPLEFLRSTSSGRLAGQLGARFVVWGARNWREALEDVLDDDLLVLYPNDDDQGLIALKKSTRRRKVVALDGSWTQTAAMLAALRRRRPSLECVAVNPSTVAALRPSSKLIDAIRPGAGRSRLSTFEAVCLALAEKGGDRATACRALERMDPLVSVVAAARPKLPPAPKVLKTKKVPQEALAAGLQRLAKGRMRSSSSSYDGARSCPLCRVTLASPNRMGDHVAGRRHCLAVASAYLQSKEAASFDLDGAFFAEEHTAAFFARLFDDFSTAPIRDQPPLEPPDVALAGLQAILRRSERASQVSPL